MNDFLVVLDFLSTFAFALVIAIEAGATQELASAIGFVLVISIRLISIKQNWNLPKIKS